MGRAEEVWLGEPEVHKGAVEEEEAEEERALAGVALLALERQELERIDREEKEQRVDHEGVQQGLPAVADRKLRSAPVETWESYGC